MVLPTAVIAILSPVVVLLLWTFIMELWMYITRISAMQRFNIKYDPKKDTKEDFNAKIPATTRWKADNFNHLHEQPTLFYAVCMIFAIIGISDNSLSMS